jgi:hypothetical protein
MPRKIFWLSYARPAMAPARASGVSLPLRLRSTSILRPCRLYSSMRLHIFRGTPLSGRVWVSFSSFLFWISPQNLSFTMARSKGTRPALRPAGASADSRDNRAFDQLRLAGGIGGRSPGNRGRMEGGGGDTFRHASEQESAIGFHCDHGRGLERRAGDSCMGGGLRTCRDRQDEATVHLQPWARQL